MKPPKRTGARHAARARRRWLAAVGGILAAVALIGVVVAGYLIDGENGTTVSVPRGTEITGREPGGPVVRLASWSGGGPLDLGRPGRPTVVLAMAGWCSTCLQPARDLVAIQKEFGSRIQIIAVSVDPGETEDTLKRFRAAAGDPAYLWGFDSEGTVAHAFELQYLDTVVLLDAMGKQLHNSVRPSNGELRRVLANALGEPR